MDLQALFERIGYTDGGTDTERLIRLHRAYATHVPFENIDVYNGLDISLKTEDLFEKIVTRRRGGYCFEMNAFFAAILRELGFPVKPVLTRLSRDGKTYNGYLHRMNLTEADGMRYICDVGYGGDCFIRPLRIEFDVPQPVHGMVYKVVPGIDPSVEYSVLIQRNPGEDFVALMGFIDRPAADEDFQICNYYVNKSPWSGFRMMLMLNQFTDTGRYSLMNLFFTLQEGEKKERRELKWEELPGVLKQYFGLDAMPDHEPKPLRFG